MKIEQVPLTSIRPHPRNYREHPDDQLDHLKQSITEHGIYRNIVVSSDNYILAGHGVTKACTALGMTEVPIIRIDVPHTDPKALKLLAADNELSNLAVIDDRALTELLKEIKDTDLDGLLGTGFDESMLASLVMVTRPASEIGGIDAAREWVGAGMPAHDPAEKRVVLSVFFTSEEDRAKFVEEFKIPPILTKRQSVWSTYWPERTRDDQSSVRFE